MTWNNSKPEERAQDERVAAQSYNPRRDNRSVSERRDAEESGSRAAQRDATAERVNRARS